MWFMDGTFTDADVQAIGLLAVLACSLTLFVGSPRPRHVESRRAVLAAACVAFIGFVVFAANAHLCREGSPVRQVIVPALGCWVAVCFARGWIRTGACAAFLIIMVSLAFRYVDLVHTPQWTGYPHSLRPVARQMANQSYLNNLRLHLQAALVDDSTKYAAGWLLESELAPLLPSHVGEWELCRDVIGRCWHSYLTALFPKRQVEQGYWYPGGQPSEAISRIEIRDRP